MADLYDVILYGLRGEGEEREIALHTVARLLKLESETIEAGVARPDGMVIQSGVTEDVVRKYQSALGKIGGLSRFEITAPKPAAAGIDPSSPPRGETSPPMAGGLSLAPLAADATAPTAAPSPPAVEPPAFGSSGLNLSLEAIDESGTETKPPVAAVTVAEAPPAAPMSSGPSAFTLETVEAPDEAEETLEISDPYPPAEPTAHIEGLTLPFSFEMPSGEAVAQQQAAIPAHPSAETPHLLPIEEAVVTDTTGSGPAEPQTDPDEISERIKRRIAELQQIRELHALEEGIHPAQQLHRRYSDQTSEQQSDNRWIKLLQGLPLGRGVTLWAVGLAMGLAGGAGVYALLHQPDVQPAQQASAPPLPAAEPAPAKDAGDRPQNLAPELEAQLQLATFAESLPPATAITATAPQPTEPPPGVAATAPELTSVHSGTGEVTITGNALAVIKPVVDPAVALDNLRHDRTWPRHLSNLCVHLLENGQAERAYQMALEIPESDAKWLTLLTVTDFLQRQGKVADRNQIVTRFQSILDTLDDKPRRIAALRLIARHLVEQGETQPAMDALNQAEAQLPQLTTRAAKIAAYGHLAAMFLDLGDRAKAEVALHETNHIIAEETYPQTRLAYYVDLANGYTAANRRDSAIALLTGALRLTDRLPPADRPVLLRSLAIGFARARDVESAQAVISRMQGTDVAEAATLDLIRELVAQGRPYAAITVIGHLTQPVYQARAEAAVAWSLKVDAQQDAFARNLFNHATELLNNIGHPADQALAMADVGRYQFWADLVETVPSLNNAASAAQRVSEPHMRDLALAVVVGEYARSAQWPSARGVQAMIADSAISAAAAEDTGRIMKALEPRPAETEPTPAAPPPDGAETASPPAP